MPPKSKINRSDVLNVAFQLTQKKGINYINARNIAKELNCSTTPIFRVYSCMEELIDELIEKYMNIIIISTNLYKMRIMMNYSWLVLLTLNLQEKKDVYLKLSIFLILVAEERYLRFLTLTSIKILSIK